MSFFNKIVLVLSATLALTGCNPSFTEETGERDRPLIDLHGLDVAVVCEDGQPSANYREANVLLMTFEIYTGARAVHLRNTNIQDFFIPNEEYYPWYEVEFALADIRLVQLETLEVLASGELTFNDFNLFTWQFDALHTVNRYSSSLMGVMADADGSPNSIGSEQLTSLKSMDFIYADTGETVPWQSVGFANCFDEGGLSHPSTVLITNLPL